MAAVRHGQHLPKPLAAVSALLSPTAFASLWPLATVMLQAFVEMAALQEAADLKKGLSAFDCTCGSAAILLTSSKPSDTCITGSVRLHGITNSCKQVSAAPRQSAAALRPALALAPA